jgi:hypothetical protein
MVKNIDYPVSLRALQKWVETRLEKLSSGAVRSYRFRYDGSTCSNGGTPFHAYLYLEISGPAEKAVIQKAWIEIPEDQKALAEKMCSAVNSGNPSGFFERLATPARFCGKPLAKVLGEEAPVNYAGCFCAPPMVRDKWNMVLSAVHYLENRDRD